MRFKPTAAVLLQAALAAWAISAASAAELTVRDTGNFVIDRAEVIDSATEVRLERLLKELEQKTTAQVKILTVRTTEGEDFFGFVQRHFDLWKLGRAKADNGALIALAVQERQVRIHTGYGLESTLPDIWCAATSRDAATKYFRNQQYSAGLNQIALAVADRVAAASNVKLGGGSPPPATPGHYRRRGSPASLPCIVFLVLVFLLLAGRFGGGRRHRRIWGGNLWDALFWASLFNDMGRPARGWGSGTRGGFGGGSFGGGGLGGGGGFGGSFGGGGRSGGGGGGASW